MNNFVISKKLPARGLKLIKKTGTWVEEKQVEESLNAYIRILSEERRYENKNRLITADWIDEEKEAMVTKNVGNHLEVFGHSKQGKTYLCPEEALFLVEMNRLLLTTNNTIMSVQRCYATLLSDDSSCNWNEYRVFLHLCQCGYKVFRCKKLDACNKKILKSQKAFESNFEKNSPYLNLRDIILLAVKNHIRPLLTEGAKIIVGGEPLAELTQVDDRTPIDVDNPVDEKMHAVAKGADLKKPVITVKKFLGNESFLSTNNTDETAPNTSFDETNNHRNNRHSSSVIQPASLSPQIGDSPLINRQMDKSHICSRPKNDNYNRSFINPVRNGAFQVNHNFVPQNVLNGASVNWTVPPESSNFLLNPAVVNNNTSENITTCMQNIPNEGSCFLPGTLNGMAGPPGTFMQNCILPWNTSCLTPVQNGPNYSRNFVTDISNGIVVATPMENDGLTNPTGLLNSTFNGNHYNESPQLSGFNQNNNANELLEKYENLASMTNKMLQHTNKMAHFIRGNNTNAWNRNKNNYNENLKPNNYIKPKMWWDYRNDNRRKNFLNNNTDRNAYNRPRANNRLPYKFQNFAPRNNNTFFKNRNNTFNPAPLNKHKRWYNRNGNNYDHTDNKNYEVPRKHDFEQDKIFNNNNNARRHTDNKNFGVQRKHDGFGPVNSVRYFNNNARRASSFKIEKTDGWLNLKIPNKFERKNDSNFDDDDVQILNSNNPKIERNENNILVITIDSSDDENETTFNDKQKNDKKLPAAKSSSDSSEDSDIISTDNSDDETSSNKNIKKIKLKCSAEDDKTLRLNNGKEESIFNNREILRTFVENLAGKNKLRCKLSCRYYVKKYGTCKHYRCHTGINEKGSTDWRILLKIFAQKARGHFPVQCDDRNTRTSSPVNENGQNTLDWLDQSINNLRSKRIQVSDKSEVSGPKNTRSSTNPVDKKRKNINQLDQSTNSGRAKKPQVPQKSKLDGVRPEMLVEVVHKKSGLNSEESCIKEQQTSFKGSDIILEAENPTITLEAARHVPGENCGTFMVRQDCIEVGANFGDSEESVIVPGNSGITLETSRKAFDEITGNTNPCLNRLSDEDVVNNEENEGLEYQREVDSEDNGPIFEIDYEHDFLRLKLLRLKNNQLCFILEFLVNYCNAALTKLRDAVSEEEIDAVLSRDITHGILHETTIKANLKTYFLDRLKNKNGPTDDPVKPLLFGKQYTSYKNILQTLQIFDTVDHSDNDVSEYIKRIKYDVYLPTSKFPKTKRPAPHYRVIIFGSSEDIPSVEVLKDICCSLNDGIPLLCAIVYDNSVSFFQVGNNAIPVLND